MSTETKGDKIGEDYLPGQLDFYTELFEPAPGKGKKRKHPASKLDDIAFLFDPPEEEKEGPEDGSEWSYGEV